MAWRREGEGWVDVLRGLKWEKLKSSRAKKYADYSRCASFSTENEC
jgi:hypothetical protein